MLRGAAVTLRGHHRHQRSQLRSRASRVPAPCKDEAMRAGVEPETARPADARITSTTWISTSALRRSRNREIEGRNMWMVWTGGNDRLWDRLTVDSLGTFDLLKTISSHPPTNDYKTAYGRHNRWRVSRSRQRTVLQGSDRPRSESLRTLARRARSGVSARSVRRCGQIPWRHDRRAREDGSGRLLLRRADRHRRPAAVPESGLRRKGAAQRWDAERFYNDPTYYFDRDLVRPYRVGMSCAFCHVGPNPIRPPADAGGAEVGEPERERRRAVLLVGPRLQLAGRRRTRRSLFYQALHVSRPGTLDTSLVSTDNINNPRTMNAVYYLRAADGTGAEVGAANRSTGGERLNRQFNEFVRRQTIRCRSSSSGRAPSGRPRVLKDGSDSVGALGALNRVYLNIGLFSEEWLLHFRAVIGGKADFADSDRDREKNSVYWRATELRTPDMARFFLASTESASPARRTGRRAVSDGQPADAAARQGSVRRSLRALPLEQAAGSCPPGLDLGTRQRTRLPDRRGTSTGTGPRPTRSRRRCGRRSCDDDFLRGQLPLERAARPDHAARHQRLQPAGDQRDRGNIWDNFSSQSYKQLPSAGTIKVRHPVTGAEYRLSAARRRPRIHPAGVARQPLVDRAVSPEQYGRPFRVRSPDGRCRGCDRSRTPIEQMLWPERATKDALFANENGSRCRHHRSHHGRQLPRRRRRATSPIT